jgi:hypothetical protein
VSRFQVGDRVRLSEEAVRVKPRTSRAREGYVRMITSDRLTPTVYVRWDGRTSDEGFHEVYLDMVERPAR